MVKTPTIQMNKQQVTELIRAIFPQAQLGRNDYQIDDISPGVVITHLNPEEHHLRPGGTISGPSMMTLVDISAYILLLAHYGPIAMAVTTNMTIDFLNKPKLEKVFCRSTFLKMGKRLVITRHEIENDDQVMLAHSTATYSIPPEK